MGAEGRRRQGRRWFPAKLESGVCRGASVEAVKTYGTLYGTLNSEAYGGTLVILRMCLLHLSGQEADYEGGGGGSVSA